MALEPVEFNSLNDLYDFVERVTYRTALVLVPDAAFRPWVRTVSAECRDIVWLYPAEPLTEQFSKHLSNFAHTPLPDNGFVLLEHGKIVAVIDVDAINGASRPDRLAMYVKRAFEPKRSSDRASVPGSKAAIAIGDPYEVLGVSASASDEEIKSKYKKLLLEYHPDRVAHLGQELRELAERKTTQINAALSEIRNRRKI